MLKTRLATTVAVERKSNRDSAGAMDTPDDPPGTQKKRSRADDLHMALCVDKGIVKLYAPSREHEMKARWDVSYASPIDGADAVTSA